MALPQKWRAYHRGRPRLQPRIPERAQLGNCLFGYGGRRNQAGTDWCPVISARSSALRIPFTGRLPAAELAAVSCETLPLPADDAKANKGPLSSPASIAW